MYRHSILFVSLICGTFLAACIPDPSGVRPIDPDDDAGANQQVNQNDDGGETNSGEPDVDPVDPSCENEVQDGDETGVDCGGPLCRPCDVGDRCEENRDCVDYVGGEWGPCEPTSPDDDSCTRSGQESRDVSIVECVGQVCEIMGPDVQSRDCVVDTDDQPCGEVQSCHYGPCTSTSDSCDDGYRTASCIHHVCQSGFCVPDQRDSEELCPIEDGDSCQCLSLLQGTCEDGNCKNCGDVGGDPCACPIEQYCCESGCQDDPCDS
jgi:hypothetical protein